MASLTRPGSRSRERDERRDAVERRVLAAVDRLLDTGVTYTELPVARIAAEADIARSTFYRYFPDKSQLLIRMADLATDDQFRTAELWWAADHLDGEAGVVTAMRLMIAGTRSHHRVLRALTEVAGYDRDVGRYWQERVQRFTELVRLRLDRERAAGRVPADLEVEATAIALTCMVERAIDFTFAAGNPVDDEQLARALGRAIWQTVYAS
ncbi:TetR/AcrR family transcriptional regulator [Nocardia sp. MDA0666]|uniref:TetR/AcrR family transcriptional regulator n=1 Tax=Nocardia sp. MDA0666 TaxID=2135448 RepID=UPI000D1348EA|nr:TetR/AcrR family transcriptional regulator [Nocardia sp. MDA0666]PSR65701.1 TetR/AcrR family transcriptional regulator [Nocardia sp. MDA0666]